MRVQVIKSFDILTALKQAVWHWLSSLNLKKNPVSLLTIHSITHIKNSRGSMPTALPVLAPGPLQGFSERVPRMVAKGAEHLSPT
jgi:hypothetical protein